jgi:hypothetical protein
VRRRGRGADRIFDAHDAEKDRLWIDARMALHEITGYDRPTAKAWRALWAEKSKGWDPVQSRGKDDPWRFQVPDGSKPEKVVAGEKVVVCVDTSGSLHIRDPRPGDPPPQDPLKKCPDCGRNHGPGTADAPPERQRVERAKGASNMILGGLRARSKFQLVRFDTTARSLNVRGLMLEASMHNRENARDFLAPVEANGVTKMVRGIDESFACEDMDVLYLITDGAPTDENSPNTTQAVIVDEVVALTRVLNRFRGVRIYPIGFKQARAPLLEVIAAENWGNVSYLE